MTSPDSSRTPAATDLDVVVVGAGFGGLYMLHRLRQAGFRAVVLEAGDNVGGTWYWNRYPGARCDVESIEYAYSFSDDIQKAWNWSERFSPQPEILAYINFVADQLDLRRDIRFNTRVTAALFDEATHTWTVTTQSGDQIKARFCVMATGCLFVTRLPDIKGLDSFKGRILHSAHWPETPVDFSGKRVGIIGTGSSGVQIIPTIAPDCGSLHVFQRTPCYSVPARNGPMPQETTDYWKANHAALKARARNTRTLILHEYGQVSARDMDAASQRRELDRRWEKGGPNFMYAFNDVVKDAYANSVIADYIREQIRETVKDPETARRLSPMDYPVGAKRICVDTDYYRTYNRENVSLVDLREEPIVRVTEGGIETASRTIPLDMLILATGFDAITGSLLAIDIRTTGGFSLREAWKDGPRSYIGMSVADLPNLFVVIGPGSPSVFSNMVMSAEHDVEWITRCLGDLRDSGITRIAATDAAQDQWGETVNQAVSGTLLAQAASWYQGANIPGKPRVFMPFVGGADAYRRHCAEVAEHGYRGFILTPASTEPGAQSA